MKNVLGNLIIRFVTRVKLKGRADVFKVYDDMRGWNTCGLFTMAACDEFNYRQDRLGEFSVKNGVQVTDSERIMYKN